MSIKSGRIQNAVHFPKRKYSIKYNFSYKKTLDSSHLANISDNYIPDVNLLYFSFTNNRKSLFAFYPVL